jgi:chromosome segregation ATPase
MENIYLELGIKELISKIGEQKCIIETLEEDEEKLQNELRESIQHIEALKHDLKELSNLFYKLKKGQNGC